MSPAPSDFLLAVLQNWNRTCNCIERIACAPRDDRRDERAQIGGLQSEQEGLRRRAEIRDAGC